MLPDWDQQTMQVPVLSHHVLTLRMNKQTKQHRKRNNKHPFERRQRAEHSEEQLPT